MKSDANNIYDMPFTPELKLSYGDYFYQTVEVLAGDFVNSVTEDYSEEVEEFILCIQKNPQANVRTLSGEEEAIAGVDFLRNCLEDVCLQLRY